MFYTEYEDILNRAAETITAQVSTLTSAMLDRVFAMSLGGSHEGKQAVRDTVLVEIRAEMQRFQHKYEESRELLYTMRKNFLKELQHLKTKEAIQAPPKRVSRLAGQLSSFQQQVAQQNFIEFSFFQPTEGMDEETVGIFNETFSRMKAQFESKLAALNAINQELAWKVGLVDDSRKVADMSSRELVELLFAKQKDRGLLWLQLRGKFSAEELEAIAEEEFAELV